MSGDESYLTCDMIGCTSKVYKSQMRPLKYTRSAPLVFSLIRGGVGNSRKNECTGHYRPIEVSLLCAAEIGSYSGSVPCIYVD